MWERVDMVMIAMVSSKYDVVKKKDKLRVKEKITSLSILTMSFSLHLLLLEYGLLSLQYPALSIRLERPTSCAI